MVQIVALACETPQASEHPVSHWTPTELATEAVKRDIVKKISPPSVGRFLKRSKSAPVSLPLKIQAIAKRCCEAQIAFWHLSNISTEP